jgi:hypothetical protein
MSGILQPVLERFATYVRKESTGVASALVTQLEARLKKKEVTKKGGSPRRRFSPDKKDSLLIGSGVNHNANISINNSIFSSSSYESINSYGSALAEVFPPSAVRLVKQRLQGSIFEYENLLVNTFSIFKLAMLCLPVVGEPSNPNINLPVKSNPSANPGTINGNRNTNGIDGNPSPSSTANPLRTMTPTPRASPGEVYFVNNNNNTQSAVSESAVSDGRLNPNQPSGIAESNESSTESAEVTSEVAFTVVSDTDFFSFPVGSFYGDTDWMNFAIGLRGPKYLIPDAGHHVYLDNPWCLMKAIEVFLGDRGL